MPEEDISSMQLIFCVQSLAELYHIEEWCWRLKNFFAASIERVSEGYQREIWILEGQIDVRSEVKCKLTFEYVFDIQTAYQKK
jgi:hypothetical protein